MLNKLLSFTKAEYCQLIAVTIAIGVLLWAYGCQSQVASLGDPSRMVTRTELSAELDAILALATIRYNHLDRQDELKQIIFNNAIIMAQGGQINLFGVMATVGGVLGIGATVDNVRKRKVIKKELNRTVEYAHKKTASGNA